MEKIYEDIARRTGGDIYIGDDVIIGLKNRDAHRPPKAADIISVDAASLVDIRDIVIDSSKPWRERAIAYIRQAKNPYLVRYGSAVVGMSFADTDVSFEECVESCFGSL